VLVQIYGVTEVEDARIVNELAPDHVGVVLDEGIDTWDSVGEATLRLIRRELTSTTVVALSLSTDLDRIRRTVDTVLPDVLHLARAAEGLGRDALKRLRTEIAPIRLMITIPVRGPDAVRTARAFAPVSDWLLLDTAHPTTGVVGATGIVHDWAWSRQVVEAVPVPVVLAGGLGPENVSDAIAAVGPAGVDSETRTSHLDDRRRKDPRKVRQFIERARAAGTPGNRPC
jgi:phosphoribosylanthranilate isomerase